MSEWAMRVVEILSLLTLGFLAIAFVMGIIVYAFEIYNQVVRVILIIFIACTLLCFVGTIGFGVVYGIFSIVNSDSSESILQNLSLFYI